MILCKGVVWNIWLTCKRRHTVALCCIYDVGKGLIICQIGNKKNTESRLGVGLC